MANAHAAAKTALENTADNMKRFADKKGNDAPAYQVGDKVWLSNKYLATNQLTKKLAHRHFGPFKIVQVISPSAMKLELPPTWKNHPVFHISLLTLVKDNLTIHPVVDQPPPIEVAREEEYEVEKIVDS
jgi:hypothetical protein